MINKDEKTNANQYEILFCFDVVVAMRMYIHKLSIIL